MGIFDAAYSDKLFATYAGELTFRDRTAGGCPSDPKMIEGWLRAKAGLTNDEERRQVVIRTLREMKPELFMALNEDGTPLLNIETSSYDDLVAASAKAASDKQSNGFKRPDGKHLALETRHLKAMTKEVINVLYSAERWGPTRKGPKNFAAERVFIDPALPTVEEIRRDVQRAQARNGQSLGSINAMASALSALTQPDGTPTYPEFLFLQRSDGSLITEPDDVETFIGHVVGPKGPQSNLTLVQVVKRATVRFNVKVMQDAISHEYWPHIWIAAQENGLGAMRSQSYGRFDLTQFDQISGSFKKAKWDMDPTSAPTEDQIAEFQLARERAIAEGIIVPEATEHLVRV